MAGLTPMMQQYKDIKDKYGDTILFFRLGDFYEMFFEDAIVASRELELTLTGKDCGQPERAPMCGVPFHAASGYISKLVNKGYKVAICEQVEEPSQAKGLVKRDVVKIVTPGTVTETEMLDDTKNNYLMSILKYKDCFGVAYIDISTGEFFTTVIKDGNIENNLIDEVAKVGPSEIIVPGNQKADEVYKDISKRFNVFISEFGDAFFEYEQALSCIANFITDDIITDGNKRAAVLASGALFEYVHNTQKSGLNHIKCISWYSIEQFMTLDYSARRNLELTETMREKNKKGSLIWVLDKTMTSMGARTLRKWIEQPLININDINNRLDAVEELKDDFIARSEIRECLKKVYDIERLAGKISIGNINCRDLISLKSSLEQLPSIKSILEQLNTDLSISIRKGLDTLDDVHTLIDDSIIQEPPITLKEGGIIKTGFNEEVDTLRLATTEGRRWIAELESREKQRTGIKNLKIGFNKVFGYFIEVTKSYYDLVPENYIRKQTLANCERYITDELKKIEDTILGAEDKVVVLEYNLFTKIREQVNNEVGRIKNTAECISTLDVLCSLAEVAQRENYVKPEIVDDGVLLIKDGRHPVVEKMIGENAFVPNDTYLDTDDDRLSIITGPNMAGKSTYMRQVALIVLMAQIGSFVSASQAVIGVADKIFTRVGASDDLSLGQSTFMVEMNEVANIISNATPKSLIILDEIGRGTSTYDGLSIAWSVVEYIADKKKIGARTLFATHYHELTELEDKIDGVKNYCISVEKNGEDIIFLRKIIRGGADESYGIYVAKLSGVPDDVIQRAQDILKTLEKEQMSKLEKKFKLSIQPIEGQVDLFSLDKKNKLGEEIVKELKVTDITILTPLDAMNLLYKLQQKVKKE